MPRSELDGHHGEVERTGAWDQSGEKGASNCDGAGRERRRLSIGRRNRLERCCRTAQEHAIPTGIILN